MKAIMFKEDLFREIAKGNKTQTRRIIRGIESYSYDFVGWADDVRAIFRNKDYGDQVSYPVAYQKGKTHYIKEPWLELEDDGKKKLIYEYDRDPQYEDPRFRKLFPKFRPKMFMPERVARYYLVITDIRVQQLCMISINDLYAEGFGGKDNPASAFQLRWDQINGPGSYGSNPWVFAYTFNVTKVTKENPVT